MHMLIYVYIYISRFTFHFSILDAFLRQFVDWKRTDGVEVGCRRWVNGILNLPIRHTLFSDALLPQRGAADSSF